MEVGNRTVNDFYRPLFLVCHKCCSPLIISGEIIPTIFNQEKAYQRLLARSKATES